MIQKRWILCSVAFCLVAALLFAQDSIFTSKESGLPVNGTAQLVPEEASSSQPTEPPAEPEKPAEPIPAYRQVDAFANATNDKGMQGMLSPRYGGQHTLLNLWMDSYIDDEDPGTFNACWPYEYNGKTFYFDLSGIEQLMHTIKSLNDQNMTVSVVFLLKYTEGREFLIDELARVPGHEYYAFATDEYGKDAIKAFFEFFMWRCAAWNASVDNFILGNEINNPNTWHYSGTLDGATVASKYASTFCDMYNIVRKYTAISRCSIPLDHNWAYADRGRQIAGRTMLDLFHAELEKIQPGVDWCLAYHLYPAIMYNNAIWRQSGYNSISPDAMFIDGANLQVLSDYVKENFGEQHRIMLTEQGFSLYDNSELNQAAALAITYYAAKYNPMVESFILNCDKSSDSRLHFQISGYLAETVYEKLDDGNDVHKAEIEALVLEASGRTLSELVPGYEPAPVQATE